MSQTNEKTALLAMPTSQKSASVTAEEPVERLDKTLILYLVVTSMIVALALMSYVRVMVKCATYLAADAQLTTAAGVHECMWSLGSVCAVFVLVVGVFGHAVRATCKLAEKKNVISLV